ncbi:MAG: CDP-diacylglycerol--serine O-phosphatidyltransferase [Peptococcaceae bacterium]|nr:CDP-diacylglycerol--serine O-phosphatidyltransferase [Candidatus Syntrophopropionicum ammoniitolerans]
MIEINALPNICTGGNLLFGVLAIAAVFNHNYVLATVLIILAAILDRLDGYLARRYNSSSDFGRELDSLADLVSFGVAPSVMLYAALAEKWHLLGLVGFAFFVLCGAFRLARYNISGSTDHFRGLPITAGGTTLAILMVLFFHNPPVILVASVIIALAMISSIPIPRI